MCRNRRLPTQRPALFWARQSGTPHARRPRDQGGMRGNRQACRWQRRGGDAMRIGADGSIPVETRRGSATTTLNTHAILLTQVTQAPVSLPSPWPKAICQAGSNDWKNSSGWKNVRTAKALSRRNATRKRKTLAAEEGGCVTRRAELEVGIASESSSSANQSSTVKRYRRCQLRWP